MVAMKRLLEKLSSKLVLANLHPNDGSNTSLGSNHKECVDKQLARIRKLVEYLGVYEEIRSHTQNGIIGQNTFYVPEDLHKAEQNFLSLAAQKYEVWSLPATPAEQQLVDIAYEFALEESRNYLRAYRWIEEQTLKEPGIKMDAVPRSRTERQAYYIRCLDIFKDLVHGKANRRLEPGNLQYIRATEYYRNMLDVAIKDEMHTEIDQLIKNCEDAELPDEEKAERAYEVYQNYNTPDWNSLVQRNFGGHFGSAQPYTRDRVNMTLSTVELAEEEEEA